MTVFPVELVERPPRGLIIPAHSLGQPMADIARLFVGTPVSAVWPAANRAVYIPFLVQSRQCVVTQLFFYLDVFSAANYDIGIYDATKKRVVSMGSTAVPNTPATMVLANIADTALLPGQYWLGMVVSVAATLTVFRHATANYLAVASGMQQEALGSTVLPDPPTFANLSSSFQPICGLLLDKTL